MFLRVAVLALFVLLTAIDCLAADPLSEATEAFRRADWPSAAKLFATAAEAESDSAKRAEIRLRLAQVYFLMNNRLKAEEALAAALADQPQLELDPELYTDDFLRAFTRAKTRAASGSARPAPPAATTAAGAGTLVAIRRRLAEAVDNTALEGALADIQVLESDTPPSSLADVLDLKAEALDRLGRSGEAIEQRGRIMGLRAAAAAPPNTSVVPLDALLEARRLIASGRPEDAGALMGGVLQALPSCVAALEVRGEALLESGSLDDAATALRTAMITSEKPELWLLLGEVELKRGRIPSARDAFRRAVDLDPGNDRALAALGLLAARMEDVSTAREMLDKALNANGTLLEARVVRAQIALVDHQVSIGLQHLQRALQIRPDDPWVNGWFGVANLAVGTLPAAIDGLQAARQAGMESFSLPLAEAMRRQGKVAEALGLLDGLRDAGAEGRMVRARCLLDAGRPAEAVNLLRELSASRPGSGRERFLLGAALHSSRNWSEAATALAAASDLGGAPATVQEAASNADETRLAQELMDSALVPPPPPPKG
jgi:tetratricopeptide (TPR) repeat protein